MESADDCKVATMRSAVQEFLRSYNTEQPLDCPLSVTSGQTLARCEPIYRHNLCWACDLEETDHRNASAYRGPRRDPYLPQEAQASYKFETLARFAPLPGLTRDLLDGDVSRTSLSTYARSLRLPIAGVLLAAFWLLIALSGFLPKWLCRCCCRRKKIRALSSRARKRRAIALGAIIVLTCVVIVAVAITIKASMLPEYNLPSCLASRTLYEANYGVFETHQDTQSFQAVPDFYSGLVRVEHVMHYLFTLVSQLGFLVDNASFSNSLKMSFKSIYAPTFFTSQNLRSTPYISWKSQEGDHNPVTLKHDLALALVMKNESIFDWDKIYSDHLMMIASLGEMEIPAQLSEAMARVQAAGDDFRSRAGEALSPLYSGVDTFTRSVNKVQRAVYGDKSWAPRILSAFPLVLSLSSIVTIICVLIFGFFSRPAARAHRIFRSVGKGGAVFIAALIGGLTLGSGSLLIALNILLSDTCNIVGQDLLQNNAYKKYKSFNGTLPLSILEQCIYNNGSGDLYAAMGLQEHLQTWQKNVEDYEAELAIYVKPGEQLFSFIDDAVIPTEFLRLLNESTWAGTVLPGGWSEAPWLFMTEAEFVWSTDAVETAVSFASISDPLLKPLLQSLWSAGESATLDFPSLGNKFPWLNEAPQLLPLSSLKTRLDKMFAECPHLEGRKICPGFDKSCRPAEDIMVDFTNIFWMDPAWFVNEETLVLNLENFINTARTQRMRRLMDCLRTMSTRDFVRAALALYQTVIKSLVFGNHNLERHIDAYTNASVEICPLGSACPLFYGLYADEEEMRLELLTKKDWGPQLIRWTQMATRALNPQLAYQSVAAFLRLNPLQQVWASVNTAPETFNCKILHTMLERSEKALCKRVAPGMVVIAIGWIVCGLSTISITCLLLYLWNPPDPQLERSDSLLNAPSP